MSEGSDPRPSPDGARIAYMSGKGKTRQIWLMGADGKNPQPLTKNPSGLGGWAFDFVWAPDSKSIAYCTAASEDAKAIQRKAREAREKMHGSSVVVYGSAHDLPPPAEIWIVDLGKKTERKIASYDTSLTALSWFPDSKSLLVYGFRQGSAYREKVDASDVIVVDAATGKRRNLVSAGGEEQYGAASPDGSQVAFYYDADDVRYPDMYEISLIPTAGGPIRKLTKKYVTGGRPFWSPDGRGIYFTAKINAFSQIFFVTPAGELKQITTSEAGAPNVCLSPDGHHLSWQEEDAAGRKHLVVADADGSGQKTIRNLTPQFDELALGEAKEVRWKSTDGLEIAGMLVTPPDFTPGKRYPMVVDLHGGAVGGVSPEGQIICIGPLERQIWATKGYVVFAPDFRTSGVYGWDRIVAGRDKSDFMERDFDDIMTGVEHVIQMGFVDPDRMVAGGHSYGGVETEWIITHSHRFKAAIAYEGGGDWYRLYGDMYSVGGNTSLAWQFKGRPWEVPENYFKNSALYMMKGVTIPTMFIVGDGTEYGGSYPSEYEFMYSALKQQGVETQMLLYKKEGHVVFKPENVRDLTNRVVQWVDDHLK